jgi:hypothetical protein
MQLFVLTYDFARAGFFVILAASRVPCLTSGIAPEMYLNKALNGPLAPI